MHLDYHLEMMMGSQLDMRESAMVWMKGIPTEKHLDYNWEMSMGSQMDMKKE